MVSNMLTFQYWNCMGVENMKLKAGNNLQPESKPFRRLTGRSSFVFHGLKNFPLHHYDELTSLSVKEMDIKRPRWFILHNPPVSAES